MLNQKFSKETFDTESLAVFEKLLQGYKRAKETDVWESNINELVDNLTHLPTAPFSRELMKLFDYNYLALSEPIETIIDKALVIREQMEHTKRYVTVSEKYFTVPFFPSKTFLKRLEITNNEGELCYQQKGKLRINYRSLFKFLTPWNKTTSIHDVIFFKQEAIQHQQLEIFYYSPIIDLSSKEPCDYYKFFTDYYGKLQFMNYFKTKDKFDVGLNKKINVNERNYDKILKLTSSQQVLWAYFLFRLMGLNLRSNLEVSAITRFLHLVNQVDINEYKNSYYYKLFSKAPYIKEDKRLLVDLEKIRIYFKEKKLPTGDIEQVIANILTG